MRSLRLRTNVLELLSTAPYRVCWIWDVLDMGIKYTQEQVHNIFANAGCALLDCKKQKFKKTKTLTQAEIEQQFTQRGCTLLDNYTRSDQYLTYRCRCGNIAVTTWDAFKQGHYCKKCGHARGEKHYLYNPDRALIQLRRLLRKKIYSLVYICLKDNKSLKIKKTEELLGYINVSFSQGHRWQLDHIIPIQAFFDHGITDPALICALDNLRPLAPDENQSKGSFYTEDQFEQYCKDHHFTIEKSIK